jgi:hypothetical protein
MQKKKRGGKTSRVEFRAYLFTRTRPYNKKDGQSRSLIALRISLYIVGLVNFFFFLTLVVIYLYTPQINNHVVVPFLYFFIFRRRVEITRPLYFDAGTGL